MCRHWAAHARPLGGQRVTQLGYHSALGIQLGYHNALGTQRGYHSALGTQAPTGSQLAAQAGLPMGHPQLPI